MSLLPADGCLVACHDAPHVCELLATVPSAASIQTYGLESGAEWQAVAWHADATGNYSGFGSTTSNKTFLRGVQTTDANGAATFATIYPGWYQGRAVHIHIKVYAGGSAVHTGQLFFDDSVTGTVFGTAPYNSRGNGWLRNAQDGIYNNGGSQSLVQVAKDTAGYTGTMTLGVRT
jgi:hypothetical protein